MFETENQLRYFPQQPAKRLEHINKGDDFLSSEEIMQFSISNTLWSAHFNEH